MRTAILPFALALAGLFFTSAPVLGGEGCDYCVNTIPKTHSRGKITKVCTEEVDRCTQKRQAKGPCGKIYVYTVTVITYKDVYSDGSTRIWNSTI